MKRVTTIAAAVAQARADFSDVGGGVGATRGSLARVVSLGAFLGFFRIAPMILAGIGGAASLAGPSEATIGYLVVVPVVQGLGFPAGPASPVRLQGRRGVQVPRDPLRPHQARRRASHPASLPPDPPLTVLGSDGETICASSPAPCDPLSRAERAYW